FDGLSERDQKLVLAAAAHAHQVILKEAEKLDAYGLGRIVRTNPSYKIVTLTESERAPFKKSAEAVQASFASKSDSNKKVLDQMMADLKEAEANAK
ncbi:MAG: C4-dicarboxylate ABC transporter, partial [Deltaproteobacteria bacterium]|nr:C4-dicarboxylate ABC transporter [Deltaproteobacteria bacterium]